MKTIFSFVAGLIAGIFGWTMALIFIDDHDDSFMIKSFSGASKRYQDDIGRAYDDGRKKGRKQTREEIWNSFSNDEE